MGWDAPLATYFAMCFDEPNTGSDEEYDVEVFWIGADPQEITTVDDLVTALREHQVELPADLIEKLLADKDLEGDRRAGRPGTRIIAASVEAGA
ncbi:hypothetical protein GCM10023194_81190 [Planotetraspora phitsanulokensis]|uniref:hypothetical protein n=1 Tax=Planotetraspora phitsanulokensis TaxID=575192 RepID=UPI00194DE8D3|nr:hypothetical protein [Planotetraspora phitsanulokensis]